MHHIFTSFVSATLAWGSLHALSLISILIGALFAHYFAKKLVARIIRRFVKQGKGSKIAEEKRENTLVQVMSGSANVLIWLTAAMMILSEVGIAIGPLLAAAGVAGLALGFGGQYLIRDLISGMFIILENQYRSGDVVCFDATCGLVEGISLRMTTLRDLDGTVHHVPHGEIHTVSNLSKGFSRVNVDVGVSYRTDLEQLIEVVNRVGNELAEDPAWKESVLAAPQFLRVEAFAESALVVKILGDTQPIKQWEVAGELRKRLKIAFDKAGIEIALPQRVLHTQTAAKSAIPKRTRVRRSADPAEADDVD